MPYVAGFLAFRETPVLLALLKKMASKAPLLYPQLLMVDGNGILHPRGFGLASHLGVLADIPTIGIGKNLHHIDGLTNLEVRHDFSESNLPAGTGMPLIGSTGQVWGMAFRSHDGCSKPVFISVGHRISLDTAVEVVRRCCLHRVPEPVRQADIRSREHLRKHPISESQPTWLNGMNPLVPSWPKVAASISFNRNWNKSFLEASRKVTNYTNWNKQSDPTFANNRGYDLKVTINLATPSVSEKDPCFFCKNTKETSFFFFHKQREYEVWKWTFRLGT